MKCVVLQLYPRLLQFLSFPETIYVLRLIPFLNIGVIKAVVFRDAKELKDDPSIHLAAAAAAAAAAAYGRHSVNIDDA